VKRVRWSLTTRLTALYTLAAASVMAGLGVLVSQTVNRHFVELDRDLLADQVRLVQQIGREAPSQDAMNQGLDTLLASHSGLFVELRQGGQAVYSVGTEVFRHAPPLPTAATVDWTVDWTVGERVLRGRAAQVPMAPERVPGGTLALRIAVDTVHHTHFMQALHRTLALYLLGTLLLSGLLGWWVARRGLRPLRLMKERATAVTAQQLDQRMPVEAVPVEFADLALSLNAMLDRLQADFERLQAFSSDLAHELRTPINNLLTQTQVSLVQRREVHEYQDILASNAEEFQRLARMVSDMLLLAKTEHGIELPHREPVALRDEVQALFDFYEAVADEKRIRLQCEGAAVVAGDRLMLRRAVSNLLSNALRHSPADATVRIVIDTDGAATPATRLCVVNTGAVIPAEDLPRLFDRFYRVDKSRRHPQADGAGLGLSITQAIMRAHGGRVAVRSDASGTAFCLQFASVDGA
jgi:two-component system heavy metal sensor histidine kinase CusS